VWQKDGAEVDVLEGHRSRVTTVAWNPEADQLASSGYNEIVRIWNFDGSAPQIVSGEAVTKRFAWNPDGLSLALADTDATRLWTPGTVAKPATVFGAKGGHAVDWSGDGDLVAFGFWDHLIRIFDKEGQPIRELTWPDEALATLAWKPGGRHLACGDRGGALWVGDADSGNADWGILLPVPGKAVSLKASGEFIAADQEVIDNELIFLVEQDDGRLEILTPSEFQERVAVALPLTCRARLLPSTKLENGHADVKSD
jgi:WD40 repeat protein